jgi:Ca-activated chloride channel family protein
MTGVGVLAPRVLLLLCALPLLALATRRRGGGTAATALRVLAATGLVLALAGAYVRWPRPSGGACVVLLIDVSASVQRAGLDAAARLLPALERARGPRDLVGAVAFARQPRVLVMPSSVPIPPARLDDAGLDPGGSDVGAALRLAPALCPDGMQPATILLSDGQDTQRAALAEAAFTDPPVPVFPVSLDPAALPPAAIRRVLAPARAPDGQLVPLEAVVESRAPVPVEATVAVAADGREPLDVPATLLPGLTVVALPYRAHGAGRHVLDAALRLPADGPPLPGAMRVALQVSGAPRVVVATERATSVVAAVLAERGMEVERVAPAALAARVSRLSGAEVVVLDDVARGTVAAETLRDLRGWVGGGGALVVTGGPHLFGDPAWADSPLAPALPVELLSQAPEPKEREPIALELVIDRSNSMGFTTRPDPASEGEKMEYARRAALAVLDQLGPHDLVGAIAFDSKPYELGALAPAGDSRDALAARIRALRHGGGTDFKEALDLARRDLVAADRPVRHVILLTDGDTNRRSGDHDDLIVLLARDEITVTAIRIGSDTGNLELLRRIAEATGGEFHHVADASALPQLMIRDTRRLIDAPGSLVNAPVHVAEWGPMLAGLPVDDLPPVARWAATRLKDDAELRLYLDAGSRRDPLLATWQYGLGRVAVLPADFQSGAAEWAGWDGFGKLWSQLVLWAMPPAAEAMDEVERAGGEYRAVGPNLPLLRALAAATGGMMDPDPASLLAARAGVEHEAVPLAPYLLPIVILAVLGDVVLRQLRRRAG